MHAHYQKSESQAWISVISWNFQRMLKREDQLTKRQNANATTNITTATTPTFIATTTPITTTCMVKRIKMKISKIIWIYRLSKGHFSNVIVTANCIKLELAELDERDVLLTERQYVNTTSATSTSAITINTDSFFPWTHRKSIHSWNL